MSQPDPLGQQQYYQQVLHYYYCAHYYGAYYYISTISTLVEIVHVYIGIWRALTREPQKNSGSHISRSISSRVCTPRKGGAVPASRRRRRKGSAGLGYKLLKSPLSSDFEYQI